MVVVSLVALGGSTVGLRRVAWAVLVSLSFVVCGGALWFAVLQLAVIGQLCPYCMVDHGLGFGAGVLVLVSAPIWRSSRAHGPAVAVAPLLLPAAVAIGALVVGQMLIKPKLFGVQTFSTPASQSSPTVAAAIADPVQPPDPPPVPVNQTPVATTTAVVTPPPPSTDPVPVTVRRVSVAAGKVQVNTQDWPVLGSADAKYIIVEMFDYSCPICRNLHPILEQAIQNYGGQLAIVAMVVPLNSNCNPLVTETDPHHVNACDYARDSLAVLRADRGKWAAYDHWLFEGTEPPSPQQARAKAEELVGAEAFAKALADVSVEQHIKDGVGLYQAIGGGKIPKLIMPRTAIYGQIDRVEWLYEVFQSHLGIDPPVAPK